MEPAEAVWYVPCAKKSSSKFERGPVRLSVADATTPSYRYKNRVTNITV